MRLENPSTTEKRSADGVHLPAIRPFAAGLLFGVGLAAGLLFSANRTGVITDFDIFTTSDEAALKIPAGDVGLAIPEIDQLVSVVSKARTMLEGNDPGIKIGVADKFVHFARAFPDLFRDAPAIVRVNSRLTVRRDGAAYKILVESSVCPIAVAKRVFEADPRRERKYKMLCRYFGVWNEAGKNF